MKKIQLIFCTDFNFQIIQVLPNTSTEDAWDNANELFAEVPELGESYDVIAFDTMKEMNSYVLEQCKDNKKYTLAPEPEPEEKVFEEERQWNVPVCRIGYRHTMVAVSAHSESEAIAKAIDEAQDFGSEKDADYTTPSGAMLITDKNK